MVEVELKDLIRLGTARGLDFTIIDELRKRTGVNPDSVLKFALGEMMCNALDKEHATEIDINVQLDGDFVGLEVSDNGNKKLTLGEIKLILDFESKASSKRGLFMVSRGYLGNALKCIFGFSYALAELKGLSPPPIIIRSGNHEYAITLNPDRAKGVIDSRIVTTTRRDDRLTTFIVKFPADAVVPPGCALVLRDLIFATSMVNPDRKICYNIFGENGTLGSEQASSKPIRQETSVLWYTQKQFQSLFEDFLRARPQTQLKEFIPLFRGFTSKKVVREILQELTMSANHDSQTGDSVQFFPATPIKDMPGQMLSKLFAVMKAKAKAKPIAKRSIASVLGVVGEESFEKVREQNGWERLRHTMMPGIRVECPGYYYHGDGPCRNPDHVEFPVLIELAVFDRKQDGDGLKVYQSVNFMASMEDIFSRIYNINYHLGRVGISKDMPVTVVAHLVCPVLKWLNYGKSGLGE